MPGRLVMEQQHTLGSQDLKKDRSHVQGGDTAQRQEIPQKLGQNGSTSNGASVQSVGNMSTSGPEHGLPTPPELDQSWRHSDANKPMGVLVERLAQVCLGDLNEALTKMAEVPQSTTQTNGIVPHDKDTSEASISKKTTLMDFAHNQRDRFIKTLVLSDWARSADDMARLVDIKVWQEKQVAAQRNAMEFIGVMKTNMAGAKMPNPNIEGALELLATGKASHIPDLGYLPAKRLTAKQLLRTLQDMNVTLATRLNLHEELPYHFNDFSIANGRATFRVSQEFEVDLSVADEDPSTPFYFIDIRFLFSPTPSLSDEGLRGALEARANVALASDGPKGCYDFLHNFVLTHKINMLRDQAFTLLREKWFDCLSIELKKRVLIIQYWSGMPGPKSWLEIGVSTGKQKSKQRSERATPQLSLRWFRKGKEVKADDAAIHVDWQDLSAETIMAVATAKHISWTLTSIRDRLKEASGMERKLAVVVKTSESTPEDCSLLLRLPGLRTSIVVRVASVTGKWSISPASPLAARTERTLNTDPNADPVLSLIQLLCQLVQERVSKAADLAGWKPVSRQALVPLPTATVTALFGPGIVSRSIYRCSTGWGESWALIATFGMAGEKWWATRLDQHTNPTGVALRVIGEARQICANLFADGGNVSRAQLLRVEKLAAAEIAKAVLTQELAEKGIRYKVVTTTPLASAQSPAGQPSPVERTAAVVFEAAPLIKSTPGVDSRLRNFHADVIRLTHTGVSITSSIDGGNELAEMRHSIRLTVKPGSLKFLQRYLLAVKRHDSEIAMNNSGGLALQLRTPFGQKYLQDIQSRLEACGRFNEYLYLLELYKHEVLALNLRRFEFVYSTSPRLTATLRFNGNDGSLPVKLTLGPVGSNPHQRARVQTEKAFNDFARKNSLVAFQNMVRILAVSLPAYRCFEKIEALRPVGAVGIHVHTPLSYVVEYKAPLPVCRVMMNLTVRDKAFRWNVGTPLVENDGRGLPEDMRYELLDICQGKGEGWFGDSRMRVVVETGKVGGVLMRIDGVVRKYGAGETGGEEADQVGDSDHVDSVLKGEQPQRPASSMKHETPQQLLPQQGPPPSSSSNHKPQQQQQLSQRNGQQQPPKQQQQQQQHQQRPGPPHRNPSKVKQEVIELD